MKLTSILSAVPGKSQPSSRVMGHNSSPSLGKSWESFKISKRMFSAIGNLRYKYLKWDKLDSMQAQANLLKIKFHSPIGLKIAKKENQVEEFWCGHSDGSSQLSFRCSQKHKLLCNPCNSAASNGRGLYFWEKEQMSIILLNLLYRLHVVRSDMRHDCLAYKATVQKPSKDLSKATEEQRQKNLSVAEEKIFF